MEFGILPAMFGMGMVNSLSEVVRIEQQTAEVALAQMHAQGQREAMQPQQTEEQVHKPLETPCPHTAPQQQIEQCLARSSTAPTAQSPTRSRQRSSDTQAESQDCQRAVRYG